MKKVLALILSLLMALSLVACGGEKAEEPAPEAEKPAAEQEAPSTESEEKEKYVIGVSLLFRQNEYYMDTEATFLNLAEQYNFELNIQDANLDLATQIKHIEDFVTMGVDAIALAPVDAAGVVPAVEEAIAKGVPVFVFDSEIDSDAPNAQIIFDLYEDGKITAEWALDYINKNMDGKANIVILDFPAEPNGSVIRSNGFQETIEAAGNPDIKIISRQDGGASRTVSMEAMENILTAHPETNMVFGVEYNTCAGAKAACEAAGRDDVAIVGLAWGVEAFEALENKDPMYKAWVVPEPAVLAENTLAIIDSYLKGDAELRGFEGESFMLDAENISDYDWRAIVAMRQD